ncbi:hypothetical protein LFML04_0986 [Leptospirillum ferriphilum ML-04]|uniref:Uncharacterized protein n=1 Tax=Leptospirillum ferriphilum (strain ML-04) TaxID=1048260 RepID=J9ZBX5_LEPFM|nr:hypothetical protein LFML04_0986 [Leptospirillum ferriphilum ML-04]
MLFLPEERWRKDQSVTKRTNVSTKGALPGAGCPLSLCPVLNSGSVQVMFQGGMRRRRTGGPPSFEIFSGARRVRKRRPREGWRMRCKKVVQGCQGNRHCVRSSVFRWSCFRDKVFFRKQ